MVSNNIYGWKPDTGYLDKNEELLHPKYASSDKHELNLQLMVSEGSEDSCRGLNGFKVT